MKTSKIIFYIFIHGLASSLMASGVPSKPAFMSPQSRLTLIPSPSGGLNHFSLSRLSSAGTDEIGSGSPAPVTVNGFYETKLDCLQHLERDIKKVLMQKDGPDPSLLMFLSTTNLSYSNLWTSEMWYRHNSRSRFFRYFLCFYSSRLLRRILPPLSALVLWSILVVSLSRGNVAGSYFNLPLVPLSLMSTFVAALLTLRTNQGLSRLNEARIAWGRCLLLARDTAQLLSSYVHPLNNRLGVLSARHLSAFGWLLKCRLRDEDDTDIVQTILPHPYSSFVNSQRKKPSAVLAHIRQTLAHLCREGTLPPGAHRSLENNLLELNRVFGICERIRGSPIPPIYTAHTSRLLVFYLVLLPCALLEQVKSSVIVGATALIGFAMLGLDEISHVLEQPFRIIPMHQMAKGVMLDVGDAFICKPPMEGEVYEEMKEKPSYW